MIVVIDNYDSFTYNLVQRLGEIDPTVDVRVVRNDEVTPQEIEAMGVERLLISPGPCTPTEAGISVECVTHFMGKVPVLGVCLGHQSIGQALGGTIVRAPMLMHGKTDAISHDNGGLFAGIPSPFVATRYHSLVIDPPTLPNSLLVSAWSDLGPTRQIMGVRHREYKLEGWQFHPESFLTEPGIELLRRFLNW
jgi:anthranilate synthase/aminodeoxychorismate synthase-like glutamine amidotransferase